MGRDASVIAAGSPVSRFLIPHEAAPLRLKCLQHTKICFASRTLCPLESDFLHLRIHVFGLVASDTLLALA